MADASERSTVLEHLRHEVADKARELSELDVVLEDYQSERLRLIRELRRLQARVLEMEEQLGLDARI